MRRGQKQNRRSATLILFVLGTCGIWHAQGYGAERVYETSFEEGAKKPKGWTSPGSKNDWVWEKEGHTGSRCISLIGHSDSEGSAAWKSDAIPVESGGVYRLAFWYKTEHEKKLRGCGMGPSEVRIAFGYSGEWKKGEIYFWVPPHMNETPLSFSIYQMKGKAYLDDVSLETMGVAYAQQDGLMLSEHEKIEKGTYVFDWRFNKRTTTIVPVVVKNTCNYMDQRIRFSPGEEVLFKFNLGRFEQLSGQLNCRLSYYIDGEAIWSASRDGKTWTELGRMRDKENIKNLAKKYEFKVPANLYPARTLFLKLSSNGSWQVNQIRYEARLSGSPPDVTGSTTFFKGHLVSVDNGPMRLLFDQSLARLASIHVGGYPIGSVGCKLAQFEKKGIGYRRTGIESSAATGIKAVEVKKNTPTECVVEVTAERSVSEPCRRKFEARYQVSVVAGQRWFRSKLLSIKNTDTVGYRVKGYYHALTPAQESARPFAFPIIAAWVSERPTLGCVMDNTEPFTLGLRKAADGPHGDITRTLDVRVDPGMTWQGNEPEVLIFTLPEKEPKGFYPRAAEFRAQAQKSAAEIASGQIKCEESKEEK